MKFNFGLFYQDLSTTSFYKSIFHVVFLMRRLVFVLTVMFLNDYPTIQLIILVKLSLAYCCYLSHYRPFAEQELNDGEIFNEVCIYLIQLSLLIMNSIIEGKTEIGLLFIALIVLNLAVNLSRIARVLVY